MRTPARSLIAAPVLAAALVTLTASADDKDRFTPLFDGKSFTGWKATVKPTKDGATVDWKNTWSVVDGTIRCTGKPNGFLATEKEYGDYVLRVKWRFPAEGEGGNSGVLLHVQDEKYWPTSIEAQLLTGRAGDFWLIYPPEVALDVYKSRQDPKEPRHYFREPKDGDVEKKFGEWNQYEITCQGGDITLVINGRRVNEGKNGNLKKGKISLQSEGSEIFFKDIEIKMLK
jgi:hypothetical protein